MYEVILIIHVVIALALVTMIVIQKTDSDGMGGLAGGSGNSGSIFTGRGKANFLTRTTAILATAFFVTSLTLAYIGSSERSSSILDSATPSGQSAPEKTEQKTSEPVVPKAQ